MIEALCWEIRATGLAAAALSAVVGVSDIILLTNGRVGAGLDFEAMTQMPRWRLVWGGALGAVVLPLMAVGMWHLYRGLAPAGVWLALPPALLLGYFFCVGSALHLSYAHIGAVLTARDNSSGPGAQAALLRAYRLQQSILAAVAVPGIAAGALGAIWLALAVFTGPTQYPRWFAFTNPILLGLPLFFADRWLPPRIGGFVKAPFIHLAFVPFFLLSTALLWGCKGNIQH